MITSAQGLSERKAEQSKGFIFYEVVKTSECSTGTYPQA